MILELLRENLANSLGNWVLGVVSSENVGVRVPYEGGFAVGRLMRRRGWNIVSLNGMKRGLEDSIIRLNMRSNP